VVKSKRRQFCRNSLKQEEKMGIRKIVSFLILFILIFITVEKNTFSAQKIGKIVYSTRGTGYKIWVMNEDGTNNYQLTFGPGVDGGPRWSPDGSRIAFNSNRDTGRKYEVFVMDADGTNLQKIASLARLYEIISVKSLRLRAIKA
jgi:hypothetical protein